MESFFTRFKNVLVLVAILLAQTIGLAVQVRRPVESGAPDGSSVTLLRYWTVSAVTPFERFFFSNPDGYVFEVITDDAAKEV